MSVRLSVHDRGSVVLRDIAVDDLSHSNMATVRHQIECLCLHTRRGHCSPLQISLIQLGVGYLLCLLGD